MLSYFQTISVAYIILLFVVLFRNSLWGVVLHLYPYVRKKNILHIFTQHILHKVLLEMMTPLYYSHRGHCKDYSYKRNAVVLNTEQLQIREFLSSLLGKERKKERKSDAIGTKEEKGSKAIHACEISLQCER